MDKAYNSNEKHKSFQLREFLELLVEARELIAHGFCQIPKSHVELSIIS